MPQESKPPDRRKKNDTVHKRPVLRRLLIGSIVAAVFIGIFALGMVLYNNVSFAGNADFAEGLDAAIEKALVWTETHKDVILAKRNIALINMLKEIESLRPTPVISDIVSSFVAKPIPPMCWTRLIDPNWPVDELELNLTIEKLPIDNKWVLYAIAPDKARISPEELHLFDPQRWQGRKLTHQLDALLILRRTRQTQPDLQRLIEHLCNRLSKQLVFDMAVVDIYIQKVTFILRAGFPQKVRKRWVERVIANQQDDGGWNDRWLCFVSDRRRPALGLSAPPSDQHATLQALTALYLVRYAYPQYFALK